MAFAALIPMIIAAAKKKQDDSKADTAKAEEATKGMGFEAQGGKTPPPNVPVSDAPPPSESANSELTAKPAESTAPAPADAGEQKDSGGGFGKIMSSMATSNKKDGADAGSKLGFEGSAPKASAPNVDVGAPMPMLAPEASPQFGAAPGADDMQARLAALKSLMGR